MFEAEAWGKVMFNPAAENWGCYSIIQKITTMARTMTSCTTFNCFCTTLSSFQINGLLFWFEAVLYLSPAWLQTAVILTHNSLGAQLPVKAEKQLTMHWTLYKYSVECCEATAFTNYWNFDLSIDIWLDKTHLLFL